jgi:hypothetical protein
VEVKAGVEAGVCVLGESSTRDTSSAPRRHMIQHYINQYTHARVLACVHHRGELVTVPPLAREL